MAYKNRKYKSGLFLWEYKKRYSSLLETLFIKPLHSIFKKVQCLKARKKNLDFSLGKTLILRSNHFYPLQN